MKLLAEAVEVRSSEQWEQNFNEFNMIQNRYDLKCTDKKLHYPKSLLTAAIRRFNEIAETYHIDASAFKYVDISSGGVTWQVDFCCDKDDETGPKFCIYDIYWSGKSREIMQSCYSMD